MNAADALLVPVTAPRPASESLPATLVEHGLCACVNLLAVESVYRWNEAVKREAECLMPIQTAAARLEDVRGFLLARHPCQLPELVGIQWALAHPPYLQWVLHDSIAAPSLVSP